VSRFLDAAEEVEQARKPAPQYPSGWEPGVVWDGRRGTVTGPTSERPKDWNDLITSMGLDPAEVEVVEPVQMRWWDAAIGDGQAQRMYYAKANIRRRRGTGPDVEELVAHISRRPRRRNDGGGAADGTPYLLGLADLQLGKKGTTAAVDRIVDGIEASAKRLRGLRRKRTIPACYVAGLGDIGENCSGHYDMQAFESELDGREQSRLARDLIRYAIEQHRGLTERVVVPCVAGNHGEKRIGGKAYTTFGDNTDIEVFEQVAEAYEMAGAKDVSFVIPQQTLSLSLDIGGVIVGMIHGHQAAKVRGDSPMSKVRNWWVNQMAGKRPTADADLLLTGHFHQPWLQTVGQRANVGFPTEDSGSPWFAEVFGLESSAGMLSMLIGKDYPLGCGDWCIT
jgi:predicted phosphodiesterase